MLFSNVIKYPSFDNLEIVIFFLRLYRSIVIVSGTPTIPESQARIKHTCGVCETGAGAGGGVIVAPFLRFCNCVITTALQFVRIENIQIELPAIICQARTSKRERWRERLSHLRDRGLPNRNMQKRTEKK